MCIILDGTVDVSMKHIPRKLCEFRKSKNITGAEENREADSQQHQQLSSVLNGEGVP